jgi:hypothetical protein
MLGRLRAPRPVVLTVPELGHVEADLEHRLLEQLAVFALLDGVGLGADHLDAVLVEDAGACAGPSTG